MESLFGGTYVSCIKIGDKPIVPPLLDDQQKKEMRFFRQLAISVENRTKPRKLNNDTGSSSDILPTEKGFFELDPVEDADGVDLLAVELDQIDFDDSSSDASNESSNSFTFAASDPLNALERSRSFVLAENNVSGTRERRNSYTLEAPSPVLLDYIRSLRDKRCNDGSCKSYDIFVDKKTDTELSTPTVVRDLSQAEPFSKEITRRTLWDAKVPWFRKSGQSISLPNSNYVSPAKTVKRSYKSDDGLVYRDDYLSKEDREYIEKIEQSAQNISNTTTKCPAVFSDDDSFVKDFNFLDISRDANTGRERTGTFSDCSVSLNKFVSSDEKFIDCNEAEHEAFSYFKEQLKLKHRQQLASLLLEHQREYDMLQEQFLKNSQTSSRIRSSTPTTPSVVSNQRTYTKKSPNKRTVWNDSISTELPIPSPPGVSVNLEMHRAASKIQSHLRGYFTRRLFKTHKVVLLVRTIKDCLFTAVSLQNESNLGLSELDLQNRLLQQLTTACNELNDIFSLPAKERMAIIAEDRERKKKEFRRAQTSLLLSEATRRSLQRKLTSSVPAGERKQHRKRCKSASSARSDTSNNFSSSQRRPMTASFSYKYSVPQSNRKPWR